jgi:nucleotide-binding universal stress UspA family protein
LFSPVVPALVDLSKEAQMVVVGSRGRGPFARSLLGSVSSGLIRHAQCPVAVIHDEDPLMPHPAKAPVLVGIDGSPVSEVATAIAFEEASSRGVELIALHVWSDVEVFSTPSSTLDMDNPDVVAEFVRAHVVRGFAENRPRPRRAVDVR